MYHAAAMFYFAASLITFLPDVRAQPWADHCNNGNEVLKVPEWGATHDDGVLYYQLEWYMVNSICRCLLACFCVTSGQFSKSDLVFFLFFYERARAILLIGKCGIKAHEGNYVLCAAVGWSDKTIWLRSWSCKDNVFFRKLQWYLALIQKMLHIDRQINI